MLDETYFKSSIVQYSTMPEYIAVREQHYDMSRVDTATSKQSRTGRAVHSD